MKHLKLRTFLFLLPLIIEVILISSTFVNVGYCASPPFTFSNASTYQLTPTFDNDETVDPDILLDNRTSDNVYWITYAPYPYGDDSKERAEIHYSSDGSTWLESGITNPILPAPVGDSHYADQCLVFDNNTFYLYYNWNDHTTFMTYTSRKKSTDGKVWVQDGTNLLTTNYISSNPTIIVDSGVWKMWTCDTLLGAGINKTRYWTSTDGKTWTFNSFINFEGNETAHETTWSRGDGVRNWSPNVKKLSNGKYIMVTAMFEHTFGQGYSTGNTTLWYFESDNGITWNGYDTPILSYGVVGKWDEAQIYDTAWILDNGLFELWYSARDNGGVYEDFIGYTSKSVTSYFGNDVYSLNILKTDANGVTNGFGLDVLNEMLPTIMTLAVLGMMLGMLEKLSEGLEG